MCPYSSYRVLLFSVTVQKCSYSGIGTTKTDAKTNAAANALEELRANGTFAARERKLNAERRALLASTRASQQSEYRLLG